MSRVRWHVEAEKRAHGTTFEARVIRAAIRKAVRDCKAKGYLLEYWEKMTEEEMLMFESDWDQDLALEVRWEEGLEEGMERGVEKGVGIGVETVAVNALAKGLPFELIHELTGLDTEAITSLSQRVR
ncbi:MAG: hypothetical protein FWB79_05525 [Treponema sp.]|nr:hypothetical protein [Treponema sp.]